MEESKIKIFFDKIIMGIFIVLCAIAFFLFVVELPAFLNEFFNTTVFENNKYIIFFICVVLLVYVMNYYRKKRSKEKLEIILKHTDEMIGLDNFWKLHECETTAITNREVTSFFKIKFIINRKYSVEIPIELFAKIETSKDLARLDNYIIENFNENIGKQKMIVEMELRDLIEEYLNKYETKNVYKKD